MVSLISRASKELDLNTFSAMCKIFMFVFKTVYLIVIMWLTLGLIKIGDLNLTLKLLPV